MILQRTRRPQVELVAGSIYHVRAQDNDRLREQVAAVWDFLKLALENPIGLVIEPPTDTPIPLLAEIGKASSIRGHCERSFITLFTSGTTGDPKPVQKDVAGAVARTRAGSAESRWLLTYAPFRWAGLSVILHVMRSDSCLIVPASLRAADLIAAALEHQATHLGVTPSYLRRLELTTGAEVLHSLPITQVTFGGEAVTQSVLDAASRIWPSARVSHVYASTELGDLCSVSDGMAGVPRRKFEREPFSLSDDGELYVDGVPTGDLWCLIGDRYQFRGRRQEIINVGGAKVSPWDVERSALSVPGVAEVRAFGVSSPLLGQVVGLEYSGTIETDALRRELLERLPKVAVPARVRRVDRIVLTVAAKTDRLSGTRNG